MRDIFSREETILCEFRSKKILKLESCFCSALTKENLTTDTFQESESKICKYIIK